MEIVESWKGEDEYLMPCPHKPESMFADGSMYSEVDGTSRELLHI